MASTKFTDERVPTPDGTDNILERDVVGSKADAGAAGAVSATESLMAYLKQCVTNTEAFATTAPLIVATASIALPQTGTTNLFTVTGAINVIEIRGFVDVQIGAVANNTKLQGGGASTDMCAVVDLNAAAQNSLLTITGTLANPMIINSGSAWEAQPGKVGVGTGNIAVNCAGSDGGGGRVTWVLVYEPALSGGSAAAA